MYRRVARARPNWNLSAARRVQQQFQEFWQIRVKNVLRIEAVDAIVLVMSEQPSVSSSGELPSDLASCWAMIDAQRAMIEALTAEQDKLRALIQHLLNGHRSERRVLTDPN
jgi:hypothetical protein